MTKWLGRYIAAYSAVRRQASTPSMDYRLWADEAGTVYRPYPGRGLLSEMQKREKQLARYGVAFAGFSHAAGAFADLPEQLAKDEIQNEL